MPRCKSRPIRPGKPSGSQKRDTSRLRGSGERVRKTSHPSPALRLSPHKSPAMLRLARLAQSLSPPAETQNESFPRISPNQIVTRPFAPRKCLATALLSMIYVNKWLQIAGFWRKVERESFRRIVPLLNPLRTAFANVFATDFLVAQTFCGSFQILRF